MKFLIYILLFLAAFGCKKKESDNPYTGTTLTDSIILSGNIIDSCTNQPLANVIVTVMAYGSFYQGVKGGSAPINGGVEFINIKTDANGHYNIRQQYTLQNVSNIDFYQKSINGYYLYHYTSDPYILTSNYNLNTKYYRVQNLQNGSVFNTYLLFYPRVYFTSCKDSIYVDDSTHHQFLSLTPKYNKSLKTIYADYSVSSHDGIHFNPIFGDTIKSSYGLIPGNIYEYYFWKKNNGIILKVTDSIFIDCQKSNYIKL